jgi:hypothetical protein
MEQFKSTILSGGFDSDGEDANIVSEEEQDSDGVLLGEAEEHGLFAEEEEEGLFAEEGESDIVFRVFSEEEGE